MKNILIALLLFSSSSFADILHPMDFDGSDKHKEQVITFIQKQVHHDYCETLDMCQPSIIRMMEDKNINAFKSLLEAKNRKILDLAIKDYCHSGIDLCNYTYINMMYQKNLKASKESLSW